MDGLAAAQHATPEAAKWREGRDAGSAVIGDRYPNLWSVQGLGKPMLGVSSSLEGRHLPKSRSRVEELTSFHENLSRVQLKLGNSTATGYGFDLREQCDPNPSAPLLLGDKHPGDLPHMSGSEANTYTAHWIGILVSDDKHAGGSDEIITGILHHRLPDLLR
jgi:hypothetical protein